MNNTSVQNIAKSKHTISAQSTATVNFGGVSPNYYMITNGGSSDLYLGITMMPTKDFYDMRIPAGSTKLYSDGLGHQNIYIFNPAASSANIIVASFEAEFSPVVLAMNGFGASFENIEITASGSISSFETSLPAGSNTIGKVNISGAIPSGSNVIGKVGLSDEAVTQIANVQKSNSQIETLLTELLEVSQPFYEYHESNQPKNTPIILSDGKILAHICIPYNHADYGKKMMIEYTEMEGANSSNWDSFSKWHVNLEDFNAHNIFHNITKFKLTAYNEETEAWDVVKSYHYITRKDKYRV